MEEKECRKCHLIQPLSEFSPFRHSADRLAYWCKKCYAALRRERRAAQKAANPEQFKLDNAAENKKWRGSAAGKSYVEANRENRRAYQIARRLANLEEEAKKAAAYYQANKEHHDAVGAAWNANNKPKLAAIQRRRRAKKNAAPVNDLSADQWEEILEAFYFRCAYCHKKSKRLTQDHVTPYARNGSNTLHNVVPCCHACNAKKGTKEAPVPVQPLLLTVASPKPLRNP